MTPKQSRKFWAGRLRRVRFSYTKAWIRVDTARLVQEWARKNRRRAPSLESVLEAMATTIDVWPCINSPYWQMYLFFWALEFERAKRNLAHQLERDFQRWRRRLVPTLRR